MNSKWKLLLYLVVIFVAGGVTGAVVSARNTRQKFFAPPKPAEITAHILKRLEKKLDLTPEQVTRIKPLILRSAQEFDALHAESLRRIGRVFEDLNQQIAVELTPEQRGRLERMDQERRESWQRHCRPHPSSDSPGPSRP